MEDHRTTLRWTRDVQRTTDGEVLALVVQRVQLGWIEVATRGAVSQKRIIVPTVPKSENHLGKFQRAVVAFAVFKVCFTAEVERLGEVGGRHHIPTRAAAADMIKRRKLACQVVRFVVAGGRS